MSNKSEISNGFDFESKFPPLGHPEHHFNKYPNHPWLKNKKEIEKVLKLTKELEYEIHEDLTVSIISDSYQLPSKEMLHFPFQIRWVGYLDMSGFNVESAIGSPYVSKTVTLSENKKLTSFEGISGNIRNTLDISGIGIKDFKNMPVFKNQIDILLNRNEIENWDGFTNCRELWWWQTEWCEKNSLKLFMEAPLRISKISIPEITEFYQEKIKMNYYSMDMEWLREEQVKIMKIKQTEEMIGKSLIDEVSIKKRKL